MHNNREIRVGCLIHSTLPFQCSYSYYTHTKHLINGRIFYECVWLGYAVSYRGTCIYVPIIHYSNVRIYSQFHTWRFTSRARHWFCGAVALWRALGQVKKSYICNQGISTLFPTNTKDNWITQRIPNAVIMRWCRVTRDYITISIWWCNACYV